jgi:hypothetical protein
MCRTIHVALLILILFSCKELKKNDSLEDKDLTQVTTATGKRPRYPNLSEVIGMKDALRYWAAEESYYPTLHFDSRDTLWLEFNGQCAYSFPIKMRGDSIVVFWDIIENCTHDIGIKKSFGLKVQPEKGKPFMTLRLVNDTTLRADYRFKEWVIQFNNGYQGYKYMPDVFLSVGD